ncbi:MAG TPA: chemotaxis protein CheW, partial [Vicinamibacterales bacterium]|nr:chemotaxis protein CheW [Vicinamibacterales bacterium]
ISGMVELREAELLAHEMESYLRALRGRETVLSQGGVDALIAGVDTLDAVIKARRNDEPIPSIASAIASIVAVVRPVAADGEAAVGEGIGIANVDWVVTFVPSKELNARGMTVDAVRSRLRERGVILHASPKVLPTGIAFEFGFAGNLDQETLAAWVVDGLSASAAAATAGEPASSVLPVDPESATGLNEAGGGMQASVSSLSHYVRVDLVKLDELMRMIGDLVISRARLEGTLAGLESSIPAVKWRAVHENSAAIERQLRSLREGVVRVRLVRVGEIFRRMPFVVRDLAKESGARVRLSLHGQDTEIDKFLIERMMDPMLHLVRNAVSHGFERPAERRAAGKPEEGTLSLSAVAAGESVVIDVADDGRGIGVDDVVRRARLAGLPVPDGGVDPSSLLDLICAPGFSTRDETDRGSGRGVGMAVVKSTIQQLNGAITLDSQPGRGTRFSIELPLTLSITEAMIATVGDRTFAVPQGAVREVIEIEPRRIRRIENHEIVAYRGGTLPVVRLSRLFGLAEHARPIAHAFVVGSGAEAVAIAVDRIAGQREIVVRPTTDPMLKVDGVAGATDLGDGRVVLILNMSALARAGRGGAGPATGGAVQQARSA